MCSLPLAESGITYAKYRAGGPSAESAADHGSSTAGRSSSPGLLRRGWWAWQDCYVRKTVWALMSRPEGSLLAWAISAFFALIIILNTVTFCLETVPTQSDKEMYILG